MNLGGLDVVCPGCHGELEGDPEARSGEWTCVSCGRAFPVLLGIPDLRLTSDPYIDPEADRAKARTLAEAFDDHDLPGFIAHYYRNTAVVPPKHAAQYTRGLLAATERSADHLDSWRQSAGLRDAKGLRLLDIGCGTGPMLVAARGMTSTAVGIDIAFRWLIVARKRLSEAGLNTPLICGSATALPFRADTFEVVTAESVIEHLHDQEDLLQEVRRTLRHDGHFWFTTPNRWSIGPDPHTGLPGGSWLPDWAVARYVKWLGGIPPHRRLLSLGGLRRLVMRGGFALEAIELPRMTHVQTEGPTWLRAAGRLYDRARRSAMLRQVLYRIGPGWSGRARLTTS